MATFFVLTGALFVPTLAFAISHSGNSSSGGGGGGGGNWDLDGPEKLDWWKVSAEDGVKEIRSASGTIFTLPKDYTYAAYMWGGGKLYDEDWVTWDWLKPQISCVFYAEGAGSNLADLPNYLAEQANEDGYYLGADPSQSGLWYNPNNGEYLDAVVRCEEDSFEEGGWVYITTYADKITWEEDGAPGATTVNYDAWNWSLQDKYQYAAYTFDYQHTTPPQNVVDSFVVDAWVQTIKQIQCYWVQNGQWTLYPEYTQYHFVGEKEYKKTINYSASTPDISPEYYCPLNVNRQGYAQVGDYGITSDYVRGHYVDGPGGGFVASKKLDASVTNSQNKTNNAALETLGTRPEHALSFAK